MEQIYMNYASTSPAKSPQVTAALVDYMQQNQYLSAGRNFEGLDDTAIALRARMALGELFGVKNPSHVLFGPGATAALNMVIQGVVRPGDHVLASSIEHNSVARPLHLLQQRGVITVSWLPCAPDGTLDPAEVDRAVQKNTRLLVLSHASNVLGTVLPVQECFARAKKHGLFTVLDSAQTAGAHPVALNDDTDVIAFAGHKGLRGLAGIGGFVVAPDAHKQIEPWLVGGTGSSSHSLEQPTILPDKFESGTPNTLGILSLGVSVPQLQEQGIDGLRKREQTLTQRFIDGAQSLPLRVHGTQNAAQSAALVSVSSPAHDSGVLARDLYDTHGIITRSGLHCSPLAHRTAGTFPEGTVRFSFGWESTEEEIDTALAALEQLLAKPQQA